MRTANEERFTRGLRRARTMLPAKPVVRAPTVDPTRLLRMAVASALLVAAGAALAQSAATTGATAPAGSTTGATPASGAAAAATRGGATNASTSAPGPESTRGASGGGAPSSTSSAATASDPMQKADADMKAVLDTMQKLGVKPVATLTPVQARNQPTPADAVKRVVQQSGGKMPASGVRKVDVKYAGAAGELPLRIYTPEGDATTPRPVILYFHGGGWVIADIDTYDPSATALAKKTGAIVMSADYRRAPEHKFPAAHEDALAAYRWVIANASKHGGDPQKVALAGESAGGNLAANVAIAARDAHLQKPVAMLLIYPVAGTDMDTPSYRENANAKPLDKAGMQWFVKTATAPADAKDPRLDLVNANLKGLPPTTIVTAQIDPLRSDGEKLAAKLKAAGVRTTLKNYDGVTHEFFGMDAAVEDAKAAQDFAARQLAQALGSKPTREASADAKRTSGGTN